MDIPARIERLRAAFDQRGIDGYLVPSSDEHLNEYLPLWRCRREYLSGFSGSAGDLLVLREEAWLYADGRYHIQAEEELAGTTIHPMKVGAPGARSLTAHLAEFAAQRAGLRIGIDPMVVSEIQAQRMEETLSKVGGALVEVGGNLVDPFWSERPAVATSRLISLSPEWTGSTPAAKIAAIRADLKDAGTDAMVTVKLDQIAWLFNLRSGDDVPFNPVFESFLIIDPAGVHLFLHGGEARLPEDWPERPEDLVVHDRSEFTTYLASMSGTVLTDPSSVTRGVVSALGREDALQVRALSPIEQRKAVKNDAEQAAHRRANLRASVAKSKALLWLRRELAAAHTVTEELFRDQIETRYSEQDGYFDLSFNTIAATGPHGAIIHYAACDATPLENGHLFLVDSGAHIAGGTTDDTRTAAVGVCDAEARRVYTLVLKGHVNAARQTIPSGASGTALDALARSPLWNGGLNYSHGTGHGVGAFLNVHEGPFSIAERERSPLGPQPLREGIVSSIEPGYYREGWGGVRLENLYLYVRDETHEQNGITWLRLEPLTWIPFDGSLIERDLLEPVERAWLDAYHDECRARLHDHLTELERAGLEELIGPRLSD